jgi:hypothetical protein
MIERVCVREREIEEEERVGEGKKRAKEREK